MLQIKNYILLLLLIMPAGHLAGQSTAEADSLAASARSLADSGHYAQAASRISRALDIYRQLGIPDTTRFLDLALEHTDALLQQTEYGTALAILDEMYALADNNRFSNFLADIQNYRGLILKLQNKFPSALDYYSEALALAQVNQDSVLTAVVYDNIGSLHRAMGNYSGALEYRKNALQLFEVVGTDRNIAITLNNIGYTYIELSMNDKAFDYISRSLEIRERIGNVALLATGYSNMAIVHHNMGNYDQALIANNKALEYAGKAGRPLTQSNIYVNLGNLYKALGNLESSLEYYRESLNILIENDITAPDELSTKYKNIATVQSELGQTELSRKNYMTALELRKQAGNPRNISLSYVDMSQIEIKRGDLDSAIRYALLGKEIADSLGIKDLIIDYQIQLGQLKSERGMPEEALGHYRNAYMQSLTLSDNQQIVPLIFLATAFEATRSDSALFYGERAVEIIEETRRNIGEVSALKAGFFEPHSSFFVNLASWYLKYEDNRERAFNLVEASRARVLADELAGASEDLEAILPERDRIEKTRLLNQIHDALITLEETDAAEGQELLRQQIRQAELDYAAFVSQLRRKHPLLEKFSYPTPVDLSHARSMLDDETVILEYAFADEELLAFFVSADEVDVRRIDLSPREGKHSLFGEQINLFRDQIIAHAPIGELMSASSDIASRLIEPFYNRLKEFANIIIVPDGALAYLPFEALAIEGRFLVEEFNIKYVPSLTSLSLLQDPESAYEMDLLAFAGSDFRNSPGAESGRRSFATLPSTLAEIDTISSKFESVDLYTEGDFNEAFVKEALQKRYRYIHLATHGLIDEEKPNLSGLILSGSDPENRLADREDGLLRSSEIYQLSLQSDMVVLSACNTGFGRMMAGEGILGLQRSFFFAGVPTVTVSLWNVYDRATALLMDNFYSALIELDTSESAWTSFRRWIGWENHIPFGTTAKAMRAAKLEMIGHPLYRHPIYWAPFIVVGR